MILRRVPGFASLPSQAGLGASSLRCDARVGVLRGSAVTKDAGMRTVLDLRRVMVGTGRFELPHCSTPLRGVSPPRRLDSMRIRFAAAHGWGASWVGSHAGLRRCKQYWM